ncbi:unnamed protein product [Urochloa humidicola]
MLDEMERTYGSTETGRFISLASHEENGPIKLGQCTPKVFGGTSSEHGPFCTSFGDRCGGRIQLRFEYKVEMADSTKDEVARGRPS